MRWHRATQVRLKVAEQKDSTFTVLNHDCCFDARPAPTGLGIVSEERVGTVQASSPSLSPDGAQKSKSSFSGAKRWR